MSGAPNSPATSPAAPGRLGVPIPTQDLADYLVSLDGWVTDRRAELNQLDTAALAAPDAAAYTPDLSLSLSVWQSVADRLTQLRTIWDGGRVGQAQREQMSRLIWGRLDQRPVVADGSSSGLGVSLVEAGRLCDALTASLRARLRLDPLAADTASRLGTVRAALRRCEDLLAAGVQTADASGIATSDGMVQPLFRRLDGLRTRAGEGADVSGPLAVLDGEVARLERDLIVAAAGRHQLRRDRQEVRARREELERREQALRPVAARCRSLVADPPRFAVPDVDALGAVPADRPALDAYARRLNLVAAALATVEAAYAGPVAEWEELAGRLDAYQAKASATGRAEEPQVRTAYRAARQELDRRPCRLPEARRRLAEYQALLTGSGLTGSGLAGSGQAGSGPAGSAPTRSAAVQTGSRPAAGQAAASQAAAGQPAQPGRG